MCVTEAGAVGVDRAWLMLTLRTGLNTLNLHIYDVFNVDACSEKKYGRVRIRTEMKPFRA